MSDHERSELILGVEDKMFICTICRSVSTREETVDERGTIWRMVCALHGVIASGATLNEGALDIGPIE
jgi:hypothetical protein